MKTRQVVIFIILGVIAVFLLIKQSVESNNQLINESSNQEIVQNSYKVVEVEITPNSTYGILMEQAEVDANVAKAIFDATKDVYDLSNIRVGRSLFLHYDSQTDEFKQLVYQIDSEEELYVMYHVTCNMYQIQATSTGQIEEEGCWVAERQDIDYEIKIKTGQGTIKSSMYQAALDNDIDIRAIIELADAYQWNIDFAADPRVGDIFKFIYEERYRDGKYVMPGQILAGKYVNQGKDFYVFYFEETDDNKGFFDEQANSVQRMFLKAPIHYKYISSGFTTGLRCLEVFHLCTNHRAIDYAAAIGTPIRAVGDGTVVFAGWNSKGYGYFTSIRHNATYTTNYAHQSRILVKVGQKVKQGEIIGKVGSTGLSTGPHLHYEIVKHGVKVNPQDVVLPPGKPIKDENKERFYREIGEYQSQLNPN